MDEPETNGIGGEAVTDMFKTQPRRLVLCFDGTGNKFQGDDSDTNIVKIYEMLERDTPGQYHYYQPGIGTYQKGQAQSSAGVFNILPAIKSGIQNTLDQMLGSSFVDHVTAGYEFVMRYYAPGDHIYIFGFSRGAYTARFLAEMIFNIGLLSKGNEEMIQFAWETFGNYQQSRGNDPQTDKDVKVKEYMDKFKNNFCRPHIDIHFIGLFDCVNSVGQFEVPLFRSSYQYMAQPAAQHIRHAVSIHERRLKFKPALFNFEGQTQPLSFKEVWFAGNHADVGGGWGKVEGQKHLLSDTPLNWMVQEVLNLPKSESRLSFTTLEVGERKRIEFAFPDRKIAAPSAAWKLRRQTNQPHDMLRFGGGERWYMTLAWWIMECLPIFTRLELEDGKWVPRYWPPNLGAARDIPIEATIHESVHNMVSAGILDKMPHQGGDNSHFPDAALFHDAFNRLRKKREAAKQREQQQRNGDDRTPLLQH